MDIGKKWGVKVQDINLPGIGDAGTCLTMHSIDVTPKMKESVMEGQVMFRKKSANGKEITPLSNAGKKKVNSTKMNDQKLLGLTGGSLFDSATETDEYGDGEVRFRKVTDKKALD